MRQDLSKNMFVSPNDVLGYSAVLNLIKSGRGLRKTHNYLKWICRRFINHGEEFAYVRRQQNEIDDSAPFLFKGLEQYDAKYFPRGCFRIVGNAIIFNKDIYDGRTEADEETEENQKDKAHLKAKIKPKDSLKAGDIICGYTFSLSTAHTKKSTPYPRVRNMLFDEYQLETGQDQSKEPAKLFSLMETIFRDRANVRAFMLANNVSDNDPYFNELSKYPVKDRLKGEITFFREDRTLIQIADRPLFQDYKRHRGIQTAIGKTTYGQHIIQNTAINDNLDHVGYIHNKKAWFNFIAGGKNFTFYYMNDKHGNDGVYIGKLSKEQHLPWLTTDSETYKRDNYVGRQTRSYLSRLLERYKTTSQLYYENLMIKQYIIPYLY